MKSPLKKLLQPPKPFSKPNSQSSTKTLPDFPTLPSVNPQIAPLPTLSLSPSSHNALAQFLKSHLASPINPSRLLSFLRNKLHHHPSFTHFDFHVFRWAPTIDDSFRHDHSTYEWMSRTLAVTHRFDDLNSLLHTILSEPCPCSDDTIFACPRVEPIFRFALNSFFRAGRLDHAVAAFEAMKRSIDGKPDVAIYNILINGFVKHGKHEQAMELYRKMVKDRVKPDVVTFNILIGSCCLSSNSDSALGIFKEMRVRGCNPNVVSFNTLIRACFREGKIEKGIGIAYEMLDLGCGFSVATCEILANGLCRAGQAIEASTLLCGFLRNGAIPNDFDCLNLIEALCREGRTQKALEVLDEFWTSGRKPSMVACTTLIEHVRIVGRVDEGLQLMERMLNDDIVLDSVTYNCLIQALCDVGQAMDANRLRLLAATKGLDPDGATFDALISGFSREGQRRQGEVVVDEMLDAGFIPDIHKYNKLMDELRKGKTVCQH
ncbi:hypothetical protein ACLOJK_025437 [Asimina triloba]